MGLKRIVGTRTFATTLVVGGVVLALAGIFLSQVGEYTASTWAYTLGLSGGVCVVLGSAFMAVIQFRGRKSQVE